ncbi:MAG: hypothetical protein QOE63_1422 [Acidimicrobiaceae bacterium]
MRNRVTPTGAIVDIDQRGTLMGNRGSIHRGHDIARPWACRRWIACVLEFRGWRAPQWEPGRWTALFFLDEAVALAAGHRPCALCRRADYMRFQDAWAAAVGGSTRADDMDVRLHADRVDGHAQRTHRRPWAELPDAVFVELDGVAARIAGDELHPWTVDGYGSSIPRPTRGDATVLTPSCTVDVLAAGFAIEP